MRPVEKTVEQIVNCYDKMVWVHLKQFQPNHHLVGPFPNRLIFAVGSSCKTLHPTSSATGTKPRRVTVMTSLRAQHTTLAHLAHFCGWMDLLAFGIIAIITELPTTQGVHLWRYVSTGRSYRAATKRLNESVLRVSWRLSNWCGNSGNVWSLLTVPKRYR